MGLWKKQLIDILIKHDEVVKIVDKSWPFTVHEFTVGPQPFEVTRGRWRHRGRRLITAHTVNEQKRRLKEAAAAVSAGWMFHVTAILWTGYAVEFYRLEDSDSVFYHVGQLLPHSTLRREPFTVTPAGHDRSHHYTVDGVLYILVLEGLRTTTGGWQNWDTLRDRAAVEQLIYQLGHSTLVDNEGPRPAFSRHTRDVVIEEDEEPAWEPPLTVLKTRGEP